MGSMVGRHMLGQGSVLILSVTAPMAAHPLIGHEDFHGNASKANQNLCFFPSQTPRDAIVMVIGFDMVIDIDRPRQGLCVNIA